VNLYAVFILLQVYFSWKFVSLFGHNTYLSIISIVCLKQKCNQENSEKRDLRGCVTSVAILIALVGVAITQLDLKRWKTLNAIYSVINLRKILLPNIPGLGHNNTIAPGTLNIAEMAKNE